MIMQNVPGVPSISPPEVPSGLGSGFVSSLASLRDILYSWWFWLGFMVLLAIISWIIINRRNNEGR